MCDCEQEESDGITVRESMVMVDQSECVSSTVHGCSSHGHGYGRARARARCHGHGRGHCRGHRHGDGHGRVQNKREFFSREIWWNVELSHTDIDLKRKVLKGLQKVS